jgi:ribose 1,5-bisphosphate isomerase
MNNKEEKFNQIVRDIKSVKIQGANNIAKSALYAYSIFKTKKAKEKLINARPTEPLLLHTLEKFDSGKLNYNEILNHFLSTQEKINKSVLKLIKKDDVIMIHCHSTAVVKALIYAKINGKKFEVYNTETRPLFQGRKTSRELSESGIKVTMFADNAINIALEKKQGTKKANKIFFGTDAILNNFVINKTGSGAIAQLALYDKIPVYVLADSWKYYPKKIEIEERNVNEIWNKAPKSIRIRNPAFELVEKKYVKAIVSEYGILSYNKFLKKVKNE